MDLSNSTVHENEDYNFLEFEYPKFHCISPQHSYFPLEECKTFSCFVPSLVNVIFF